MLDGAERHPGVGRLVRVLDEGKPAGVLDGQEAGGAVVQGTGKDYADDPRAVAPGRGAEERVDGGPVPVLPRPPRQPDVAVADEQVLVRPCDVDPSGRDGLAIHGV